MVGWLLKGDRENHLACTPSPSCGEYITMVETLDTHLYIFNTKSCLSDTLTQGVFNVFELKATQDQPKISRNHIHIHTK